MARLNELRMPPVVLIGHSMVALTSPPSPPRLRSGYVRWCSRIRTGREAQHLCPALEVVHVPGAGHNIRRDRFDLVLPAVREFLSRLVANEERPARPLR